MKHPYVNPAVLLSFLLVAGCGQKGPLFLPGDRSQIQTELPPLDRDSLEEAPENGDPDAESPPTGDDTAGPFIDPASPKPGSDGLPPPGQDSD